MNYRGVTNKKRIYPSHNTIHELFQEQVGKTPDNIAVVQGDIHITYRELDQRSNCIAHYLINQFSSKDENIVAVLQDQSINMIISIIGILKAGYAFLPLDPLLPQEALRHMLDEAGSEVVISTKNYIGLVNRLQWECRNLRTFVCLDSNDVYEEVEEKDNALMDKELWDYVGEKSEDSLGRGGWINSFTGELFSISEIDEYRKNVEIKLIPYINKNTRILEIGCASGFTMFQLAPLAGFYYGTDLSDIILERTAKEVQEGGYDNIRLKTLAAHEIDKLDETDFDIVILNSVIQAFHGHNYFRQVIKKAVQMLKDKGVIFVGDVMNQRLKHDLEDAAHSFARESINLSNKTKTDFSDELFLAPEFFSDLSLEQNELKGCKITAKIHSIENELTKYRFDAIIEVDKAFQRTKGWKKIKNQHGTSDIQKYPDTRVESRVEENNLAYVIFTSGSTGKPKGVMVEHKALVNMCNWYNSCHKINADDRSTKFANCGFDASIMELFPILIKGGSIYILDSEIKSDLNKLNSYIEDNKITICFLPTQYCEQFMELDNKTLRLVNTGGEKLKKFIKRGYTLVDNYGPTECTVVSTFFKVDRPYGNIPIGKPICNTRAYVLDSNKRLLLPGETGELYIAGGSLARGYLNRPDLTREKFIQDPFFSGERMYRTGDLARLLPDGNIEFTGRIDSQVKIRGYRIELGEIEHKLIEHPNVEQNVVDVYTRDNGEKCLCAYIVLNREMETNDLKRFLAKKLPKYMIPELFYKLDLVPLTPSGKVDRKRLPRPDGINPNSENYMEPEGDIERRLAIIWQEVLKVPSVGIHDDFFDLGGHSLKVLRAAVEINNSFEIDVSTAKLFKARTIKEQAIIISMCEQKNINPIMAAESREYYPASSSQKRIYALQQMDTHNTAYNITLAFVLKGDVSIERLKSAFIKVCKKHEILRTEFGMADGIVIQTIQDKFDIHIDYCKDTRHEANSLDLLIKEFIKPFNLNNSPLFRVKLVKLKTNEYLFLFDIHHIIIDGSSFEILWDELSKAYNEEETGRPTVQYKDFSMWQLSELAEGRLDTQRKYWLSQFDEEIPDLKLPLDFERPDTRNFEGDTYRFDINSTITDKLTRLAADCGASMNMLLIAVYKILLAKYTGCEDIVIGTPVYGRSHPDLRDNIGMFANTIALRSSPSGQKRFIEYLADIKQCILNGMENQDYPFEEVVESVIKTYDTSRNPLFDTMFVTQRFTDGNLMLDGLVLEKINFNQSKAKFDLTCYAALDGDKLSIEIEYCTRLFRKEYIIRLSRHYMKIVEEILENPQIRIYEIEIITDGEKSQIFRDFNCLKEYPVPAGTVSSLFEDAARRYGSKTALVFNNQRMTYEELNKRSNQLAAFLRKNGAKRNTVVALSAIRSFEMIIGLLGIIKAGGACLPISPDYPKEYVNAVLENGNVDIVMEYTGLEEKKTDLCSKYRVFGINDPEVEIENEDIFSCDNTLNDLLYVIYTSGTTGKPKGVMIDNNSFLNLICHQQFNTNLSFSGVLQFAAITFDVSFQEIFSALLSGGKLLLISEHDKMDVMKLFKIIQDESLETLFLPPAFLKFIFSEKEYIKKFPQSVKHIVAAGEQLIISKNLREYLNENKIYLHNHYGPSETHVVTSLTINPNKEIADRPTIGKPIPNRRVYILDKDRKLLPTGIPGELCIEIIDSVCGYINEPDLTAKKFIDNHFKHGTKLYLSGDLARWLPDGSIEFLGRLDQQIKIRGYRIEPSVVEGLLMNHSDIKNALAICHGDEINKYLCAYIASDADIVISDLKDYLKRLLPHYMIPSCFMILESFPINRNGKIDRKALPCPSFTENLEENLEDRFIEKGAFGKLTEIWKRILDVAKVRESDDFFELGGHSLKVLKVVVEINKAFNVKVTAHQLFMARTIKDQVDLIGRCENIDYIPIKNIETRDFYPTSSAQKRIYAIQNMNRTNTAYNMPFAYYIKGQVCIQSLKTAFNKLVKKHEILRTDFHIVDGQVVQRVRDENEVKIEFREMDLKNYDIEIIMESFVRPFVMNQAPLFRVEIAGIGSCEYLLLFDAHHIIMDGTSLEIFWQDLSRAYAGEDIGSLKVQYKDFASWQINELVYGKLKDQNKYWLEQFAQEVHPHVLPCDYERSEIRSYEGEIYSFRFDEQLTQRIQTFAETHNVSVNMVLFAIYSILLAKYSGQEDIIVGTPVYGRSHGDITNLIGMFANTIAIRCYPAWEKRFEGYLKEIKNTILKGMENQDYPFEYLVEGANYNSSLGYNPLFDTIFAMQKFEIESFKFCGLEITKVKTRHKKSKFDLSWFAVLNGNCIDFDIEYSTEVFKIDSIKRAAIEYEQIVRGLIEKPQTLIGNIIETGEVREARTAETIVYKAKKESSVSKRYETRNYGLKYLPTNIVEKKLINIWKEVLDIPKVGIGDNFFELGGHSLKAIMLMHRVKKEFSRDIPVHALFQYSTIKSMAELIADDRNKDWDHVVGIRKNDSCKKVFCIHPAPGTVICYYDLARYIGGDWSVYALQSKGLEKDQKPHKNVQEMAQAYIKEIKGVQQNGPYALIGWSVGGQIAYEIARQLICMGDDVEILALLDTDPVFIRRSRLLSFVSLFKYSAAAMITHRKIVCKNLNISSFGLTALYRRLRMWLSLTLAVIKYRPESLDISGKAVLFQTEEGRKIEEKLKDKSRSIGSFIDGLKIVPIKGGHLAMLSEPNVRLLGDELNKYLNKVDN
ncbi:MAG TPA: amino acid adenylation domain-containing protein [Pseudobacteroides sp.]|uniref:amino acid adenylation domain-containing protein n=1 Tax=Pseudobacteroides sp. TaxID=1968840 RepID=UPI002F92E843